MDCWWILLTLVALTVTSAEEKKDHGEYGNYNLWRTTMCEKGTDEIYEELEHCAEKEDETVRSKRISCLEKIVPSANGKMAPYMEEACKDKALFEQVDECLTENHVGYEEVDLPEEAHHCYEEVLKKHELSELLVYLEKHSHEHK